MSDGEDDQEEEEDYGESFAEEFKLKQAKMLGELQSIYDVKTGLSQKLNKITRGLTVGQEGDEADELGGAVDGGHHGLLILDEQHNSSGMPEAVQ